MSDIRIIDPRPAMFLVGTPVPTPELDKTNRVFWLKPEALKKPSSCILCELGVPKHVRR